VPYFPFPARVCLNQHHWIAEQLKKQGIRFEKSDNAFSGCADPAMLQHIADSFSPGHLITRAWKWLAYLTPFFTPQERNEHGCHHRLFVAQVEYCHNVIFRPRGRTGCPPGEIARCQSQHRPAQQAHIVVRPQNQQTLPGAATDHHRGSAPGQSRDSQPLQEPVSSNTSAITRHSVPNRPAIMSGIWV
jgi:hypothetical protein